MDSEHRREVRTGQGWQMHREFILLLVLAVAFRFMALLVFRPGGFWGDISTFGYYRLMSSFSQQGYLPLIHFWVEYPPIFPWIMIGLYRLSLFIPPWTEPGTWFYLLLSAFLALAEAGNLVLLYALARRLFDRTRALRLCWTYTLLLIPVLTLFVAFDSLVLFFLLWTILLTLDRRPLGAGLVLGLGFMTKLLPVVAAPAALLRFRSWPQRSKYLLAAALTVLLTAAPFLLTGPDLFLASFKTPLVRASWETVWALLDGYYSYGVAGGWNRFDPAHVGLAQHPSVLPWPLITAAFALIYLYLWWAAKDKLAATEPATCDLQSTTSLRTVAFIALTLHLLLLYSKGYSPQFLVMLLPFALLLVPGWRGVAYVLLLSGLSLIEFPIYFVILPDEHWLLAGAVLLRTLVILVLSLEYAAQVYGWRLSQRHWERIAVGVTALILGLGLVGAVVGFHAYTVSRYRASPHRPVMDLLTAQAAPGATIVADRQPVYEELYPFLHRRFRVRLVEPLSYLPPWEPRLQAVAEGAEGQLWLYAPADSPLHAWLADRYPRLASHEFDGWLLTGWVTQ